MRKIKNIVIHTTATYESSTVSGILRYWKTVLKWRNPGYHFIYERSGKEVEIHPIEKVSNGVRGHNQESIHLSWMGGYDGKNNMTIEQEIAILKRLVLLLEVFNDAKVCGHRDFPNVTKTCPNFDVRDWLTD